MIGYASFDPSSDTPLASPNPLPFSHFSLQEPASEAEVDGPVSSFTYDEIPESEYTYSIVMFSKKPQLEEPPVQAHYCPPPTCLRKLMTTRMTSVYRYSLVAQSYLTSI